MKMIALTALALFSSSLWARPNTVDFTCSEVREMVRDNGTFILSHGDQSLYSRFVSGFGHCNGGERAITAYALTMDEKKCNVGYVCKDRESGASVFVAPSKITVCREGTRQSFPVQDNFNSDRPRYEVRTCTNGRWFPKTPAPKIIKCKDGRRYSGEEYLHGEGYFSVTRECKNGKYVIVRKTPSNGGR